MKNKLIVFAIAVPFVVFPVVASAHGWSAPAVSCVIPVVTAPTGGGGLLYGSGPMAVGWDSAQHTNYVPYNGTTCPFNQGCMLPQ